MRKARQSRHVWLPILLASSNFVLSSPSHELRESGPFSVPSMNLWTILVTCLCAAMQPYPRTQKQKSAEELSGLGLWQSLCGQRHDRHEAATYLQCP